MTAEFYLFDVDHGQSAALRLPNGRWCIFDIGRTADFSPVQWIVGEEARRQGTSPLMQLPGVSSFKFLKATVSHFHGDHLADWQSLVQYGPEFIKTVEPDQAYMDDCVDSNSTQSWPIVTAFARHVNGLFTETRFPDYGGAAISEMSLSVDVARQLGGDANARVNNASVITRIDVYGNSILLCGDMTTDAWGAIILADRGKHGLARLPFFWLVDILVAPHHGHKSGFSVDLLNLVKPAVVLVSAVSNDQHVDSRYSQSPVRGISINGTDYGYISTRQKGHIKVTISPPQGYYGKGNRSWSFGDAAL